jgi:hypothetical protein
VGANDGGSITNSYATGSVSGEDRVGGLVGGDYGTITNSYATGSVSGVDYVGGLVGGNFGTITKSYATGVVTGTGASVGALVGQNFGSIAASYWNRDRMADGVGGGNSIVSGGGLSTAQMQQQSNFVGWDFDNIWIIYNGHTNPLLRSLMTPLTVTAANATKTYDKQGFIATNLS